jgi:hypothetical protein
MDRNVLRAAADAERQKAAELNRIADECDDHAVRERLKRLVRRWETRAAEIEKEQL